MMDRPFPASHARLCRELGSCEYKAFAAPDGDAINRDLFPETLSAVAEETERTLCAPSWLETKPHGSEKGQPPQDEDYENQALPHSAFDAFGVGRREADGGRSIVSSRTKRRNPRVALVSCCDADVLGCENW